MRVADLVKDFAVRSKLAADAGRTAESEAYQHCVNMVYQALREDPAHSEGASNLVRAAVEIVGAGSSRDAARGIPRLADALDLMGVSVDDEGG